MIHMDLFGISFQHPNAFHTLSNEVIARDMIIETNLLVRMRIVREADTSFCLQNDLYSFVGPVFQSVGQDLNL